MTSVVKGAIMKDILLKRKHIMVLRFMLSLEDYYCF